MTKGELTKWVIKPAVFLALLLPAAWLVRDTLTGNLTANPIEDITHRTGRWGLTILLGTLAITPLMKLSGWSQLIRLRRMIGLFAFFYVCLHFATYIVLDQFFSFVDMAADVVKRPYITVGFTSFVLLVPLAVTSTKGMVKRLGGRNWSRLHKLVYVAAAGGFFHFLWLVKADTRDPILYGIALVLLLSSRLLIPRVQARRAAVSRSASNPL
ncbi:MAG: sulfoxide reductase heme-binding subunit YedZ [Gemmatimonadales bacterium]